MATPYYDHGGITIYCGDCCEVLPTLGPVDLVLTDPPYGIGYKSGASGVLDRSIKQDHDTTSRDAALLLLPDVPALVFGSWKRDRPAATHTVLIWDTLGALGMGDLSIPWKPAHQEIYVIGRGFHGKRTTDVLRFPPVQARASNGRVHPNQKPVPLIKELIGKSPPGLILDPFMGSGTTLVAAKELGRRAIGIEIEEKYCEIAVKRLAQEVLPL